MADSNNNLVTTRDGRQVTYARYRYEETIKQERILAQVNTLMLDQTTPALSVGRDMAQQEYGGLLRTLVPQFVDQFGNLNATAAIQFYDDLELGWLQANGESARLRAGRKNVVKQARRYATARTASAIALAGMDAKTFQAVYAKDYELASKSERVIGWAMKQRALNGHDASVSAMNNALTREVASYHRDTVLFNAGLDENVHRVQRVAQANACSFCRMMALGSTDGSVRTSSYAVKFHDHCHCTIQPLFAGESPVRPDYYDDFEKQYKEARDNAGSGKARDILRSWSKLEVPKPAEVRLPRAVLPDGNQKVDLGRVLSGDLTDAQRLDAFKGVFEGRDFNGFTVRVDKVEALTNDFRMASFDATVIGPDGDTAGKLVRSYERNNDNGTLTVGHSFFQLYTRYKGQGFSTAFSKFSEDLYRNSGVSQITLKAALDDGAYTWAKAGYTWTRRPLALVDHLKDKARNGLSDSKLLAANNLSDSEAAALKKRVRDLASVLENREFIDPSYPTPFEIANMAGPDIDGVSFGRWLLREAGWSGKKDLIVKAPAAARLDMHTLFNQDTEYMARTNLVKEIYEPQDYNGFKVEITNVRLDPDAGETHINGRVLGPDGKTAGSFTRVFMKSGSGYTVKHEFLRLNDEYKGNGFSTAFSKFSEDFYRSSGVSEITVDAALQDGAYTWAKAGYTWSERPEALIEGLDYKAGFLRRRGFEDEAKRVSALAERLSTGNPFSADYPQPFEIANMAGQDIGNRPFAKWLLDGERWSGRKKL